MGKSIVVHDENHEPMMVALADEDHFHHLTAQEYLKVLILCHWQQEAGEEPQVPTYSCKHQQWEARSSSSTWWNWQGSWWTPYHFESQEGDPLLAVFGKLLWTILS